MPAELFEERVKKHPVARRAAFWMAGISFISGLAGLIGWNLMDGLGGKSEPAATSTAPSPTSTVPSPAPKATDGGWGPERATFTIQRPAPYAILNSITDNPNFGDERNFFGAVLNSEPKSPPLTYKDSLKVSPGEILTFRGYYENSAADNFGLANPSWVQGANAVLSYDTKPSLRKALYLTLNADNSPSIWDGLVLHSDALFTLQLVEGSGRIYNNAHGSSAGGYKYNFDDLQSADGLKIGYEVMDGTIKPGYQYDGYIYFEMKVMDAT